MILKVYAIKDRATDQFGNPMCMINNGQAIRSFSDEVNRDAPDNNLNRHADDFDLYVLGEYDTDSGLFKTDYPSQLALGKDVKVKV